MIQPPTPIWILTLQLLIPDQNKHSFGVIQFAVDALFKVCPRLDGIHIEENSFPAKVIL
jgi:hypothetical protein